MRFMQWLNSWTHRPMTDVSTTEATRQSNVVFLAEEEQRQLREVRERLERVEQQLELISQRRGS